jgi:uncharacterized OB-fold protein
MICPKCGAKIVEETEYCGECGLMVKIYKERVNPLGTDILLVAIDEKDKGTQIK